MPLTVAQLQNAIDCRCGAFGEFESYVLQLLSNIAETSASGGSGGAAVPATVAVWLPLTRVAFGAITGAYVVALADTNDKVYVSINNNTDQKVLISTDNSTDQIELIPNANYKLEPGGQNVFIDTPISLKHAGVAPATGDVTISAYYKV